MLFRLIESILDGSSASCKRKVWEVMGNQRSRASFSLFIVLFAASCMLASATMLSFATPAQADEYQIEVANVNLDDCVTYGFYGMPGEKASYKLNLVAYDENYNKSKVKGATFQFKASGKLKGKLKGNKLVFKKLPKAGKYKFSIIAMTADGAAVARVKAKFIVKKKPALKINVRAMGTNKWTRTVKKDTDIMIEMSGAFWGWHNNTEKSFFTLEAKNLKNGKVAKWNAKKGFFKKNDFINVATVAGGATPVLMGSFTQKGTYKITATVYHSNKKVVTKTTKITVK